jgi:GTP pyrophosphokinase
MSNAIPLRKGERNKILVDFYRSQEHYERLATEIRRLLDDEESPFLADSLYTVKHRLKDTDRLIQKIEQTNGRLRKGVTPISAANFQDRIEDLLGVRIVCLRLSDLAKLQGFLADLEDDQKLKILKGPIEKKTFLITPGDPEAAKDLQYSGYSSVHYVIRLGKALRPAEQIAPLKVELQLRTILEEAWGEIDHKYRYELTRAGKKVPSHVDAGFRDLALYLQAAARHVEHLCEDIARLVAEPKRPARRRPGKRAVEAPPAAPELAPAAQGVTPAAPPAAPPTHPLQEFFRALVGVEPTARAVPYLLQRLRDHSLNLGEPFTPTDLQRALDSEVMQRFTEIYREAMNKAPFQDRESSDRDLDIIPLVNFGIFSTFQSPAAAEAGLRASLRRRLLQRGH